VLVQLAIASKQVCIILFKHNIIDQTKQRIITHHLHDVNTSLSGKQPSTSSFSVQRNPANTVITALQNKGVEGEQK